MYSICIYLISVQGWIFLKKCPFCGTELPEEASFCLNCSSVLNEKPAVTKQQKKPIIVITTKKIAQVSSIICAVAIILASCFFAIKSIKKIPVAEQPVITTIVPVTEENGEIATNNNGEQIFEITEVTETTTKKNFFESLIDKVTEEDNTEVTEPVTEEDEQNSETTSEVPSTNNETSSSSSEVRTSIVNNTTEPTTKKSSFWDNAFDWDNIKFPEITEQEGTTRESTTKESTTTPIELSKPSSSGTTTTTTKPTTTVPTTTAPSTTKPTTTTPTTTKPTTTAPSQPSASDFQYVEVNGEIKITKYTGNSSTVTVPAYIDGKHVAFLGENAFANNSNIQEIVFSGTTSGTSKFYLPTKRTVFNNLPNLTSITFPYETHFRMTDDSKKQSNFTFYTMIVNCPEISEINFTDKVNPDYSSSMQRIYSVDGVVLSQMNTNKVNGQARDSELLYYPPAKTNSSYTIPTRVTLVQKHAFNDNPYIETIHFTASTTSVSGNFIGCTNLTSFTVDSDNPKLFAENGVLYTSAVKHNNVEYRAFYYPPGKTDTSFTFNDDYNMSLDGYSFCGNPYLETAKFCCGTRIDSSVATGEGKAPALTTFILNSAYTNTVNTSKSAYTYTYY